MASPGWPRGRRSVDATRAVLGAYRKAHLGSRLHAALRWWSAPFPVIEAALPSSGRILEIGCGHGLFCTYLALSGTDRAVAGVDIDANRIAQARAVAEGLDGVNLRFDVATSGTVPTGPWDGIAIVDMLYLLPAAEQRDLLTAVTAQLAPGGVLVIKEMSLTPAWKARWNRVQETLTVSVLGITKRAGRRQARFDIVGPEMMAQWLGGLGLTITTARLDRHRVHPHHLLVGRVALPD